MPALATKRGRPFLYCGHCRYGFMILAKVGMDAFDKACQEINESELIPETRKKYQELKYEGELKNEGRLEPLKEKTNPHREDDMDEKELQPLLDKRDQKLIDICLTKD